MSALFLTLLALAPARCPTASMSDLSAYLVDKGPTRVVLFATWCGPCLTHLQHPEDGETVIIAAFDESEQVEHAVAKLSIGTPCFTSTEIAETLGVKTVPAEFSYCGGIFERVR